MNSLNIKSSILNLNGFHKFLDGSTLNLPATSSVQMTTGKAKTIKY